MRPVASLALVVGALYLGWRLVDTWHGTNPVLFVLLLACEIFGWLMLASFTFLGWRLPPRARPPIGEQPTVGVFVCTYDEGIHVLEATLVGCNGINYPHTTYVLDDGRRDEVKSLATRLGAVYVTRADNRHAKAGNINHALGCTEGDLVLVLDADHVPQPDILDATVGYFDDPSVALVQTPHDFGNHDSFQHFATGLHDQSVFFEVIMPGKDRHNGAYWCGSAAVIRRRALEEIGGIATDTVAEDFHTTIRMHSHGWATRYHDETLVQGLAPHDLASFLLQRDRWARGNLAVLRTPENPLIAPHLTVRQRASYSASLLAYFVPLQRVLMIGVLTTMLIGGVLPVRAPAWQFAAFWVPWMALELTAGTLLSRGRISPWDGSYMVMLTTGIYTRAVFVLIRPFRVAFKVTPKDGIDEGGWTAARQLPLVLVIGVVLVTAVLLRALALVGVLVLPPLGPLAVGLGMSFAAWEAALIVSALWRVTRRHQVRRQYRVQVEIAGTMGGTVVRIADLTPDGAAIVAASPLAIGDEVALQMELPRLDGGTRTVRAGLTVRSCRSEDDQSWRIGGTLEPRTPEDGHALIEHCHVVSSRARLTESGRIEATSSAEQPSVGSGERGSGQTGSGQPMDLVADL